MVAPAIWIGGSHFIGGNLGSQRHFEIICVGANDCTGRGASFLVCASSVIAPATLFHRQRCMALHARRCRNLVPFFCINAGPGCLELDLGARDKMVGVSVTKEEGRGAAQARYQKTNHKKCTSPMTAASRCLCTSCSKEHKIESQKNAHRTPARASMKTERQAFDAVMKVTNKSEPIVWVCVTCQNYKLVAVTLRA